MHIVTANPTGLCFGVRRAIEELEAALRQAGAVYALGSPIHNPQEISRLESLGLVVTETPEEIPDGAWARGGRIFGGYLHGAADHPLFRRALLDLLRGLRGLPPLEGPAPTGAELRLARYDRLADFLEAHLDLEKLEALREGARR